MLHSWWNGCLFHTQSNQNGKPYSHMYLFTKETAANFRLFLILHLGTSIFLQLVTIHTVTYLLTA